LTVQTCPYYFKCDTDLYRLGVGTMNGGQVATGRSSTMIKQVGIYGAAGHTAKIVAAELLARGIMPILGGRNRAKLEAAALELKGAEIRIAHIDRPEELRYFLKGCTAVVNCAGRLQRRLCRCFARSGAGHPLPRLHDGCLDRQQSA